MPDAPASGEPGPRRGSWDEVGGFTPPGPSTLMTDWQSGLRLAQRASGPVPHQPPNPQRQAFADNVRRARERAGLTQEQLAWAADLHQTEIARIEGGHRNPGLDTILKVARGLSVPPSELFTGIA
jgi:DNA-binding XRE family transcriptional regulator